MIDRISIVDLARRQHGLVTRTQAKSAGYSPNQIKERLARGTWHVAERGIYRLASHPDSWLAGVLAATLSTGGVASHRTAGVLWGLEGIRRRQAGDHRSHRQRSDLAYRNHPPHHPMGPDRCRPSGPALRSRASPAPSSTWRGGCRSRNLLVAVDDARLRKLVDWEDLYTVYRRHSRQGRTSCGPFRSMLDRHLGEETMSRSGWNRLVQALLVDAGLPKPELEYPVVARTASPLTSISPTRSSGSASSSTRPRGTSTAPRSRSDPRRRNQLQNLGWSVLNFTWTDYAERSPSWSPPCAPRSTGRR